MPRTKRKGKPIKSKRTKSRKIKGVNKINFIRELHPDYYSRPIVSPLGGYLINPPIFCPKSVYHPVEKNVLWADLAYCFCCCPYSYQGRLGDNTCERHEWFIKASQEDRAREWKQWRVKAFGFGPHNEENTVIRTK